MILKNQLNHQLNITIPTKNLAYYNIFYKMFFSFTNLLQGNFLYCRSFLYQLKVLILPVLLLKWNNLLHWISFSVKIFISFVKLLNINWDKYNLFLSHVKSDREWTENTILALLSRRICTKIKLHKFRYKEEFV